ncbi:hypothetical protein C4B63_328g1 [Trypanosoma cruzi]|uniref:Uncharacterized protein n=1 Tax=Trypanosoma cruzi TaxID=5693 RepID=A0A2V2UHG6_TRYCR|nr:hypothetical protein C4B63_328g1 [Trypanosoma cruzi]
MFVPDQNQLHALYIFRCGELRVGKPNEEMLALLAEDDWAYLSRLKDEAHERGVSIDDLQMIEDDTAELRQKGRRWCRLPCAVCCASPLSSAASMRWCMWGHVGRWRLWMWHASYRFWRCSTSPTLPRSFSPTPISARASRGTMSSRQYAAWQPPTRRSASLIWRGNPSAQSPPTIFLSSCDGTDGSRRCSLIETPSIVDWWRTLKGRCGTTPRCRGFLQFFPRPIR